MNGWIDVASWNSGVNWPGSHCGHVEQPRPDPVSRTAPPVTMMPIWATRLATTAVQVQPVADPVEGRRAAVEGGGRAHGDQPTVRAGPSRAAARCRAQAASQRRRQCQRNSRLAPQPRAAVQPTRTTTDQAGSVPCVQASRASPRRARRTAAAARRGPAGRAAGSAGMTTPPATRQDEQQQVGDGEHRLGAQRAGDEQRERRERGRAEDDRDQRPSSDPAGSGRQPSSGGGGADHDDLHQLDDEHAEHLAGEQAAAAQRGRGQQPQHAVAPVERRRRSPAR